MPLFYDEVVVVANVTSSSGKFAEHTLFHRLQVQLRNAIINHHWQGRYKYTSFFSHRSLNLQSGIISDTLLPIPSSMTFKTLDFKCALVRSSSHILPE